MVTMNFLTVFHKSLFLNNILLSCAYCLFILMSKIFYVFLLPNVEVFSFVQASTHSFNSAIEMKVEHCMYPFYVWRTFAWCLVSCPLSKRLLRTSQYVSLGAHVQIFLSHRTCFSQFNEIHYFPRKLYRFMHRLYRFSSLLQFFPS